MLCNDFVVLQCTCEHDQQLKMASSLRLMHYPIFHTKYPVRKYGEQARCLKGGGLTRICINKEADRIDSKCFAAEDLFSVNSSP